jgi:hypothetical protein
MFPSASLSLYSFSLQFLSLQDQNPSSNPVVTNMCSQYLYETSKPNSSKEGEQDSTETPRPAPQPADPCKFGTFETTSIF